MKQLSSFGLAFRAEPKSKASVGEPNPKSLPRVKQCGMNFYELARETEGKHVVKCPLICSGKVYLHGAKN